MKKLGIIGLLLVLVVVLMPALPVSAAPGWLGDWAYRVELTIDHDDIDDNLTWLPVVLHLGTSVGINSEDVSFIFDELESDDNRKKIAVTKADGTTQLYAEIEKWDDANETTKIHVSRDGWVIDPDADTGLGKGGYSDSKRKRNSSRYIPQEL